MENGSILLISQRITHSVGYAFLKQEVNVGNGFIAEFTFQATTRGEGFVFVIQRYGISNMNGGSGGNLGFRNFEDSIGIAFDFCVDRDVNISNPNCNLAEVRLHFLDEGGMNNATSVTKKLRAPLYFPAVLNDARPHNVLIRYFDNSPNWLEVFIDNDLFLQQRAFNLTQVIRGSNAFVGFTASTGFIASDISISNMNITSVAIDDILTESVGIPNVKNGVSPLNATADGLTPVSFFLKNRDVCGNPIQFGGFGNRAYGILTLTELSNMTSQLKRSLRLVESANSTVQKGYSIIGEIVDNNSGIYEVQFRTTHPGTYSLQMFWGLTCYNETVTNSSKIPLLAPCQTNFSCSFVPDGCFFISANNVATFSPLIAATVPLLGNPSTLPIAALTGIGVAVGGISCIGTIFIFIGVRFRNRWRKDKAFIDEGRLAAAEKGVEYT